MLVGGYSALAGGRSAERLKVPVIEEPLIFTLLNGRLEVNFMQAATSEHFMLSCS